MFKACRTALHPGGVRTSRREETQLARRILLPREILVPQEAALHRYYDTRPCILSRCSS